MKRWGFVIWPAILGYAISLLLNILNFSGWGALIYRPFVSAAIWAIAALAAEYVLKRYVPQIHEAIFTNPNAPTGAKEGDEDGEESSGAEFKGNNLDVTVGEKDEGHLFSEASEAPTLGPGFEPPSSPSVKASVSKKSGGEDFPQEPQVIAKAVRTVMNQ